MALPKIRVDDRSYATLLGVLRKKIPGEDWTDHNPSDPGIMLLELLTWLGEMALYRMDRLPQSHKDKFLKLVIDPPEPATVSVTFELAPVAGPLGDIVVPAGTRLASDFELHAETGLWTRRVFETLAPAVFVAPRGNTDPKRATARAREATVITGEVLGTSDGTANQVFELNPSRTELGVDPSHPLPVLVDFVNALGGYEPNPVVSVDGTEWALKQFLLTHESLVPDVPLASREHFMVDPHDNLVRFGDGEFGTIPPPGAVIRCERYQVLLGPDAMIRKGGLVHVLDPLSSLLPGETLGFSHTDALGGLNFFAPERRTLDGLARYHRRFRLVTAADFQTALLEDFNEYQELLGADERLLRVVVLMNRKPPLSEAAPAPGHVTLLILAEDLAVHPQGLDALLRDSGAPLLDKQDAVGLSDDLIERIEAFLDRRRLITTRLNYESPTLVAVSLNLRVVIDGDRETASMRASLERTLGDYLHALSGGDDGEGWPLGASIRRSKLFRLIEELDGVDHVATLTLSPANPQGDVEIGPQSLPVLDSLSIVVERA
jgi:hypothetical protein